MSQLQALLEAAAAACGRCDNCEKGFFTHFAGVALVRHKLWTKAELHRGHVPLPVGALLMVGIPCVCSRFVSSIKTASTTPLQQGTQVGLRHCAWRVHSPKAVLQQLIVQYTWQSFAELS